MTNLFETLEEFEKERDKTKRLIARILNEKLEVKNEFED